MSKVKILLMFIYVFCFVGPGQGVEKPVFPPLENEYYPTKDYPNQSPNPYAQGRVISFGGKTEDIYLQLNMVTQMVFPAPPILASIGKQEGFVIESVPEFNSLFIKPIQAVEMTNLIVVTERGTYTFMLKETPYRKWDLRVVVADPYRQIEPTDTYTLVMTAYTGTRPAELQNIPMAIVSPNTTEYWYDPVIKMGCSVTLIRAVTFPRQSKSVYWIRLTNVLPPKVTEGNAKSYALDERSIWTQGLEKVAIPGTRDSSVPLLARGQTLDVFLVTNSASMPSRLPIRFGLQGDDLFPVSLQLNTKGDGGNIKAVETTDEKLQRMYLEMNKDKGINPELAGQKRDEIANPEEQKQSPSSPPSVQDKRDELQPLPTFPTI